MTPDLQLILRKVVNTLPAFSYRFGSEVELHRGMADVLRDAGVPFQREFVAGPQDRFDFLVPPGIVIEAKIKGSISEAGRQVARYAQREDVAAVVLVTTRYWGSTKLVDTFNGKPVRLVKLRGDSF